MASMDDVRYYCGHDTPSLSLVLKHRVENPSVLEFRCEGNKDSFSSYKMELAVVVKNVRHDGYGASLGLCENDEIKTVGHFVCLSVF